MARVTPRWPPLSVENLNIDIVAIGIASRLKHVLSSRFKHIGFAVTVLAGAQKGNDVLAPWFQSPSLESSAGAVEFARNDPWSGGHAAAGRSHLDDFAASVGQSRILTAEQFSFLGWRWRSCLHKKRETTYYREDNPGHDLPHTR